MSKESDAEAMEEEIDRRREVSSESSLLYNRERHLTPHCYNCYNVTFYLLLLETEANSSYKINRYLVTSRVLTIIIKAACQLSDLGAMHDRDWTISSSRHRDELTGGEYRIRLGQILATNRLAEFR